MSALVARQVEGWINASGPGIGLLTIEQECRTERFDALAEPDLGWTCTDAAGHFHAYGADESLPTLDPKTKHIECPGGCGLYDCDGYDVTVYYCRICRAEVEPARIIRRDVVKSFPGLKNWFAEVTLAGFTEVRSLGEPVSVRVGVYFGVGYVTHIEFNDNRTRISVAGSGDLGERKAA